MLCRDQVGDNQLGIRDRVGLKRRGVPLRDLCAESLGSLADRQGKGLREIKLRPKVGRATFQSWLN